MILAAAFGLGLATVPLAGGRLSLLGTLRLRGRRALAAAAASQLLAWLAPVPDDVAADLHVASYVAGGYALLANRRLPWMEVVSLGALCNALAVAANGGVMPASRAALAAAGLDADPGRFVNSGVVEGARLAFLGDVFAVPRRWPLANVFSVGDVLLVVGAVLVAHGVCGSRLAAAAPTR